MRDAIDQYFADKEVSGVARRARQRRLHARDSGGSDHEVRGHAGRRSRPSRIRAIRQPSLASTTSRAAHTGTGLDGDVVLGLVIEITTSLKPLLNPPRIAKSLNTDPGAGPWPGSRIPNPGYGVRLAKSRVAPTNKTVPTTMTQSRQPNRLERLRPHHDHVDKPRNASTAGIG